MKYKIFSQTLFFITIATLTVLSSCTKEDETTTSDDRDSFVGSWVTAESSQQFGNTSFTISISKSATDKENVIIKNFYNLGSSASTIAKVSGSSVTVTSQQVSAQNISGSGSRSGNKINWTYYTDDGVQKDTCTAVSTR